MSLTSTSRLLLLASFLLLFSGCQSAYYAGMEKFGVHKRDILVDRVEAARDSQEEAKEQFSSALEQFMAVQNFSGGELEKVYRRLNNELEESQERADEVHQRIEKVEDVAEALFEEWQDELESYSSAKLRRASSIRLKETRRQYRQLIQAMRRAEAKIEPVLAPLRDQVLYLKHNLNARAIASLKGDLGSIRADVSSLIRDMEKAIKEANRFINKMEKG